MSTNSMNFQFTKEQESIRKMVRDFARNEIAPIAAKIDESDQFPLELIKEIGRLGRLGIDYSNL
ncbi:acyl-CoA dehydrogenase family protein [Tepidibacillus sp. LV47]|uniref:acyl-CoA dehydrogenase family protein n=1 Tax=Tepidibacillus sp. LV47 TaxID=3398228 RepID=UPI003AAED554